ncbi:hypothetical protein U1Q18_007516 [Sarracenia purpurea var. burkii]
MKWKPNTNQEASKTENSSTPSREKQRTVESSEEGEIRRGLTRSKEGPTRSSNVSSILWPSFHSTDFAQLKCPTDGLPHVITPTPHFSSGAPTFNPAPATAPNPSHTDAIPDPLHADTVPATTLAEVNNSSRSSQSHPSASPTSSIPQRFATLESLYKRRHEEKAAATISVGGRLSNEGLGFLWEKNSKPTWTVQATTNLVMKWRIGRRQAWVEKAARVTKESGAELRGRQRCWWRDKAATTMMTISAMTVCGGSDRWWRLETTQIECVAKETNGCQGRSVVKGLGSEAM